MFKNTFIRALWISIFFSFLLFNKSSAQKDSSQKKGIQTWIDFTPGPDNSSLNLPYDSAITIKIHYKKKMDIHNVTVVKINNKELINSNIKTKDLCYLRYDWDDSLPNLNIRFDYNYNKTYVDRVLRDKSLKAQGVLKPGNKYSIIILHDVVPQIFGPEDNNSVFAQFCDYHECLLANSADPSKCDALKNKAFDHYNAIWDSARQKGYTSLVCISGQDAYDYFKDNIYLYYKAYHESAITSDAKINGDFANIDFQKDIHGAWDCIPTGFNFLRCQENPYKKIYPKPLCADSTCSASKALKALWLMTDKDLKRVNKGYITLIQVLPSAVTASDETKVQSRIDNIKKSLVALSELESFLVDLNIILQPSPYTGFKSDIVCLLSMVRKESENLKLISADLESLKKPLKKFAFDVNQASISNFSGIDIYDQDAFIFNFQTRSSAYITPVFGYGMYGFQKNFTGFTPYLGFQINFQPMNHNVPFRLIQNKTLLQRLAFTTAWSLSTVSSPGKRQDFFTKSSLYTLLGFKLSHILMFNVGTLWFKQINPDPFNPINKIVCTPAVGLSINLEIKALLNGFTGLIPSL